MASENVVEITEQNFESEVLRSPTPVLVDFWAEWCGPCRMLAPTIDKLANDYKGKVRVGKVDTDTNRELAMRYRIDSIPTVILFRNGQVSQKFVGLRNERDFKAALDAPGMTQLHLFTPRGFRGTGVYARIKSRHAPDVGLLVCDAVAAAAAVFTTNKVVAAPVKVGREHVAEGKLRGVVVNSGCANACTGKAGERDARRMCQVAAEVIGAHPGQVLPSSTGIIGHPLPMQKLEAGIRDAGQRLGDSPEHANLFADAILTTDTKRKTAAAQVKIGRETVTIAGVCKGSGMIGPRMALATSRATGRLKRSYYATMLGYLTTDATIPAFFLRELLGTATDATFNAVTVDDHASTNDTVALLASGAVGPQITKGTQAAQKFAGALREVCHSLAYQIAADGEGATKVVIVEVKEARSRGEASLIARSIANSPLVKCAMNGNDPNWGRIVSAAGMTSAVFDPDRAKLKLQATVVFRNGQPVKFDASAVSALLKAPEVKIELACGLGEGDATVLTCDLSKEYVTINADYHT